MLVAAGYKARDISAARGESQAAISRDQAPSDGIGYVWNRPMKDAFHRYQHIPYVEFTGHNVSRRQVGLGDPYEDRLPKIMRKETGAVGASNHLHTTVFRGCPDQGNPEIHN